MSTCIDNTRSAAMGRSTAPNDGFTLLELLVVMVLMIAIAGLVVPQFSKSVSRFQLQKSTRQTAAVLNETRNKAISEARETIFLLDAEKRIYTSTASDRPYAWPDGIEIGIESANAVASNSIDEIVFYPDGSTTGGRLTVSTAEHSYQIVVDWLTGHVNVYQ